ncbi:MAG: hypothetical protein JNK85_27895, partial [Verrucomicrobiales bacterium]|nr:hypothetical protein [Verrucomicrobiales bacterium]
YAVTVMPQPGYVATGSPEDPLTGSPGETLRWELGYRRRPATATEQYQDWARSVRLPDTAVEPGDDADADGASNLVEFFTGTNPLNASDHSGLHGVVRSAAGGIEVGIQVRRANGVAAVRVRLERSRDLSRWEAVSAREELRDPGPDAEQVVFWDPDAIDGSAAYFLRLRLELD